MSVLHKTIGQQTVSSPVSISSQELVGLRRQAGQIKLAKGKIRARQSGAFLSRLRGRGMEFDEVRIYQAGDDVRSIDWRVTARTSEPHTKLYREEKERPVMLCLDYRSNMHFATRGAFKSVIGSRIAALLAWAASLNGDRVGGLLFSDTAHISLKAQRGKHAVLDLFRRMCELHEGKSATSKTESSESATAIEPESLSSALGRLRRLSRPGSLVFVISDFIGLDATGHQHLTELARHCEVVLIALFDPIEAQLPKSGRYRFKDKQRDIQINTGHQGLRAEHIQRFQQHQNVLKQLAGQYRMHYFSCTTALDPVEQLRAQMERLVV